MSTALGRLALKLLWRDWRAGELNVLLAALLIAVTTVTAVGLFSDRIQRSIVDEASTLLAADAQITGSHPIPADWVQSARELGLRTATLVSFQAMTFGSANRLQLASVKAVSNDYPLKGQVEIAQQLFVSGQKVAGGPAPGAVWVNSRLLAALGLAVGETLGLGNADLRIDAALVSEPDSAGSGFGLSPRLLMNVADIEQTGAIQTGSRITYSLLMAGDVATYFQQWQPIKGEHHRWRSAADANESLAATLRRADSFLLLAGALGVVLGGVALALATRWYAERQLGHVATLKTLGLTPAMISRLYTGNLILLGLLTVVAGLLLGWLLHWLFLQLVADLLPRTLATHGARPLLIGALTGLLCLLAFALPPIYALRATPPARVLHAGAAGGQIHSWQSSLFGALAIIVLVYLYARSVTITALLLGAGLIVSLGVALLARLLIWGARALLSRVGATVRLGIASLYRNTQYNSFQIMIFALVLMLLFLLTLTRTTLLSEWQRQLPPQTPNHFAFNIFSAERSGIAELFADNQVVAMPFYPMIRGRLVQINGEPMADRLQRLEPDGDDFERELNTTWSTELAPDNAMIAGEWFDLADRAQLLVSIEQDFAEALDIALGDELTFSFGGQQVVAPVDNIRSVQWDSLAPNFYIIFSAPVLPEQGAAYLTSFYLAAEQKPLLVELLTQYPTISVIEVDVILRQIQAIVGQVTLAIEFILSLVLLAGLIVLVACVQATLEGRIQQSAIMRTVGARASMVRGALAIEFVAMGALAGILAVLGAQLALFFLQVELFNMDFRPHYGLALIGPFVGVLVIGSVGLFATRRVISVTPLQLLRSL